MTKSTKQTGAALVNVEIDWMLGHGNMPSIHITTLDEQFKCSYFKKAVGNSWLYYGTTPQFLGLVDFFAYIPSDPTGSFGRNRTVVMKDGSVDEVKGVWSSRASFVNKIVRDPRFHIVDVAVDLWSCGITVSRLKELLPADVELVLSDEQKGEPCYVVVPKKAHKMYEEIRAKKPDLFKHII